MSGMYTFYILLVVPQKKYLYIYSLLHYKIDLSLFFFWGGGGHLFIIIVEVPVDAVFDATTNSSFTKNCMTTGYCCVCVFLVVPLFYFLFESNRS
jgi:hypothetical protein